MMTLEVIYWPIPRLHLEKEIIRFPTRFENGTNIDLALVHAKRDEPFIGEFSGSMIKLRFGSF